MSSVGWVCGQLVVGGYVGDRPTDSFLRRLAEGHVGGAVLFKRNLPDVKAAFEACKMLRDAAKAPPLLAVDQEGGRVRRLGPPLLQVPSMRVLAALGGENLVEKTAEQVGRELLALGFNLNFAPVLDVNTNPKNPVIGDRAFGDTADQVARCGVAYARGLARSGVIACGKHFPGHGDTHLDSHLALPAVSTSLEQMQKVELVPFQAAIQSGIETIMTAHVVCTGLDPLMPSSLPATLSKRLVTGLLRETLGFEGLVFSDDLEMGAISLSWGVGEAAVLAVAAGCDVVLICKDEDLQAGAHEALVREAEQSAAFRERCEKAALKAMALRRAHPPMPEATVEAVLASIQTPLRNDLLATFERTSP